MAKHGFYEDYRAARELEKSKETQVHMPRDRPALIRRGFGAAVCRFFRGLLSAVLYTTALILSSVGMTTLLHKNLRDLLIEVMARMVFGGS